MTPARAGVAAVACLLTGLAGCGEGGDESPSGSVGPEPEQIEAPAAAGLEDHAPAATGLEDHAPAAVGLEDHVPAAVGLEDHVPAAAGLRGDADAEPPAGPAVLAMVDGELVQGRVGPGERPFEVALRTPGVVGHSRQIGRRTFEISLRSAQLRHYPCTSCHLPGRTDVRQEPGEDAHADIQPLHPAESAPRCLVCHSAADVELLQLVSGATVTLQRAYRLCAQCHFAQADAWANGAHGKRLDGWRGRRVLMGCADCHDPHRPALEERIPYPGPRIPSTVGGKQ